MANYGNSASPSTFGPEPETRHKSQYLCQNELVFTPHLGKEGMGMKSDDTHIGDTIRVLRPPPKVYTDRLGRSFWMPEVDESSTELNVEADGTSFDPYNTAVPRDDRWRGVDPR